MLWVTPHTSLKLPGRAARSRGRTFTGEFQSIHGILSGTFFHTPEAGAMYPMAGRAVSIKPL